MINKEMMLSTPEFEQKVEAGALKTFRKNQTTVTNQNSSRILSFPRGFDIWKTACFLIVDGITWIQFLTIV